jgi:integrase
LTDGVHHGSWSGFGTRAAAGRFADDREAAQRWPGGMGGVGVPGPVLEEWWGRWLAAQDLAPATLESYAQQHRNHIAPRWGSTPVGQISSLEVVGFERDLRAAAPAFHTGRRRRRALEDGRSGVAVDLATVRAICDRLSPDASLLALVAVFTGMRWGEVCGMRCCLLALEPASGEVPASGWYAVDPLVGAVHEDASGRRFFGSPKDGRGRTVDLPPFLADMMLEHLGAMGERDLLFPDRHRHPRRHSDWLYLWRPACDTGPPPGQRGPHHQARTASRISRPALPGPAPHPRDHAHRARRPGRNPEYL